MKKILPLFVSLAPVSCGENRCKTQTAIGQNASEENSNAKDAVFMGTDPIKDWRKPEFVNWFLPFLERGKARDFAAIERNIFLSESGDLAWFEELLTRIGIAVDRASW